MSEGKNELSVTRLIQAPPETVYRVWTERMGEYWTPKPWSTPVVENDFRVGGRGYQEMESPEGERFPNEGVWLEVVPNERIVMTNLFTTGWQPQKQSGEGCDFPIVGIFTFEPEGSGTRYTARCRHWSEADVKKHEEMGFEGGWGQMTAQLADLAEAEAGVRAAA
jgi:uncharacterized protein YndB with AHSA1/START domain